MPCRPRFQDLDHLHDVRKALWNAPGGDAGQASVMVGAGLSLNAELRDSEKLGAPTWRSLTERLIEELCPQTDPESQSRRKKAMEMAGATSGFLRLAELFKVRRGDPELNRFLVNEINNDNLLPSALHFRLLDLPWCEVFTTNWDTLLEAANRDLTRRRYSVVTTPKAIPRGPRPRIVKLHGTVPDIEPLVFSEDHFRTYQRDFAPFVNTVQQSMLESILCLVGFSGDDPNFLRWAGWVRDELGPWAPKIYLLGHADGLLEDRVFLSRLNVNLIDLSHLPEKALAPYRRAHPDADPRAHALHWVFDFLRHGKPYPAEQWPVARTYAVGIGGTDPHDMSWGIEMPDDGPGPERREPHSFSGEFGETDPQGAGRVSKQIDHILGSALDWMRSREADPGWLVLPDDNRQTLWDQTDFWLNGLPPNGAAPLEIDIEALRRHPDQLSTVEVFRLTFAVSHDPKGLETLEARMKAAQAAAPDKTSWPLGAFLAFKAGIEDADGRTLRIDTLLLLRELVWRIDRCLRRWEPKVMKAVDAVIRLPDAAVLSTWLDRRDDGKGLADWFDWHRLRVDARELRQQGEVAAQRLPGGTDDALQALCLAALVQKRRLGGHALELEALDLVLSECRWEVSVEQSRAVASRLAYERCLRRATAGQRQPALDAAREAFSAALSDADRLRAAGLIEELGEGDEAWKIRDNILEVSRLPAEARVLRVAKGDREAWIRWRRSVIGGKTGPERDEESAKDRSRLEELKALRCDPEREERLLHRSLGEMRMRDQAMALIEEAGIPMIFRPVPYIEANCLGTWPRDVVRRDMRDAARIAVDRPAEIVEVRRLVLRAFGLALRVGEAFDDIGGADGAFWSDFAVATEALSGAGLAEESWAALSLGAAEALAILNRSKEKRPRSLQRLAFALRGLARHHRLAGDGNRKKVLDQAVRAFRSRRVFGEPSAHGPLRAAFVSTLKPDMRDEDIAERLGEFAAQDILLEDGDSAYAESWPEPVMLLRRTPRAGSDARVPAKTAERLTARLLTLLESGVRAKRPRALRRIQFLRNWSDGPADGEIGARIAKHARQEFEAALKSKKTDLAELAPWLMLEDIDSKARDAFSEQYFSARTGLETLIPEDSSEERLLRAAVDLAMALEGDRGAPLYPLERPEEIEAIVVWLEALADRGTRRFWGKAGDTLRTLFRAVVELHLTHGTPEHAQAVARIAVKMDARDATLERLVPNLARLFKTHDVENGQDVLASILREGLSSGSEERVAASVGALIDWIEVTEANGDEVLDPPDSLLRSFGRVLVAKSDGSDTRVLEAIAKHIQQRATLLRSSTAVDLLRSLNLKVTRLGEEAREGRIQPPELHEKIDGVLGVLDKLEAARDTSGEAATAQIERVRKVATDCKAAWPLGTGGDEVTEAGGVSGPSRASGS